MNASNMRKIRVMRIIARMNVGGPAVQITGLMRNFDETRFDQLLVTGFCENDESDYLENVAQDVSATRIPGLGRRISLLDDIRVLISLVKLIREFKPDIIHTHTAKAGFLGRVASLISVHQSIRVHTFHGHLLYGYFGPFKRSLVILIEKILGFMTHSLLAVGGNVRRELLEVGIGTPNKFEVMSPGLGLKSLPDKEFSKTSLGLDPRQLQCAYIGRVTQIKRPDRFLDVVAISQQRGLPIHFFIAGDGNLLKVSEERIKKNKMPVKVLGWQNDIEQVLSAADIVILTSDNEGTPLSLIQAGMAGLPVITTNVGSISDIVLNDSTGLVTSKNPIDIADALEILASDEGLRLQMGVKAKAFTKSHFGVARLVADHQNLYTKLITSRAKF
jgi:glycosyltransferase involved in cell wall biosynthesis